MNRPFVLGLAGVVIVVAAIGLTYVVDSDLGKETAAVRKAPERSAGLPGPPAADTRRSSAPARQAASVAKTPDRGTQPVVPATEPSSASPSDNGAEKTATETPNSANSPVSEKPTFDVVRVNRRGDAVIAGRAAPNAAVVVRDGPKEVGTAKADSRGEWVVIPGRPLDKGSRELTLSATSGDGTATQSDRNVIIVVPDRAPQDNTGGKTGGPPGALAVLVPRKGAGESIVMQKPSEARPASLAKPAGTNREKAAAEGQSPAVVSIDAVDYDDSGNVTISGNAATEVPLTVYIDNEHAASGASDRQGRWRVVPAGELTPGVHTLRVDQLGAGGKVTGRAETRFIRAKPATPVPGNAVVQVEPGNSLWRISRRVYGRGIQYSVIYDANREQIRDPDLIYPGQVFFVPHAD